MLPRQLQAALAEALAAHASAEGAFAAERLALAEERALEAAGHRESSAAAARAVKALRREADEALRALGEREGEVRSAKASASAVQAALVSERDALARRLRTVQAGLEEERARSVALEAAAVASAEARMSAKLLSLEEQRDTDRSIVSEVRRAQRAGRSVQGCARACPRASPPPLLLCQLCALLTLHALTPARPHAPPQCRSAGTPWGR